MRSHIKTLRSIVTALAMLAVGTPDDSQACNVPAFRYALERWPADPYQIVVYYQTIPEGEAFERLRQGAAERGGAANYSLKGIDVTKPQGRALAERRRIVAFPWVEIFYPAHSQVRIPVWSGPLAPDRISRILDSRSRSRMAKRLLDGDVAVWILIKSGHEQKDRRAMEILKSHLDRASATLRIPETGTDLNGNPVEVTDFKTYPVRFSLMEVARDDPDEELLVSTLLMSEPDLEGSDEPLAFPVFGRGRALYALVGDGIQEKNIQEACQSMLNWCSCEIKALSPGTDLLISADWSRPYGGRMVKDPVIPLAGPGGFAQEQAAVEAVKRALRADTGAQPEANQVAPAACSPDGSASPRTTMPAPASSGSPLVRNVLYVAGAAGLALLALTVIATVRTRR